MQAVLLPCGFHVEHFRDPAFLRERFRVHVKHPHQNIFAREFFFKAVQLGTLYKSFFAWLSVEVQAALGKNKNEFVDCVGISHLFQNFSFGGARQNLEAHEPVFCFRQKVEFAHAMRAAPVKQYGRFFEHRGYAQIVLCVRRPELLEDYFVHFFGQAVFVQSNPPQKGDAN